MVVNFNIKNMTCSACVANVQKTVSGLKGVIKAEVRLLSNDMTVEFDEAAITADDIIKAVSKTGYPVTVQENERAKRERERSRLIEENMKNLRTRFLSSIIIMFALMYVSMGEMLSLPIVFWLDKGVYPLINAVCQAVLAFSICIINYKYFTNGFKLLFRLRPNMDSLIALGSTAAMAYSIYCTVIANYGSLYYDSAGMILALVTFGKYLESRAKRSTNNSIKRLLDLSPKKVTVKRDGELVEINAEFIARGDLISVRTGESLAADGIILEGEGELDMSSITGESVPVYKKTGDTVFTSSKNVSGTFLYRADNVGENTILSKIIGLVEQAGASKPPIARLADKISGIFVPVVLLIAFITFGVWLYIGNDLSNAISHGISVLVISCPCALGLATPISIMVGTGKASEYGILFKDAQSLEYACKCDTIVFDKTGTLTYGTPRVTDVVPAEGADSDMLVAVAASIEKVSTHPIASAIIQEAGKRRLDILKTEALAYSAGRGAEGFIDEEFCLAGNKRYMDENDIPHGHIDDVVENLALEGKTPVIIARDGVVLGVIAVMDSARETAARVISSLKKDARVIMLTGDNEKTARALAVGLGIDYIAEVLPDRKEEEIRRLQEEGRKVIMVGDGINDAPALSRADVGMAIGAGTDIAIDSADVILSTSELESVKTTINLSRATLRNIKRNLFWAFIYNIIGIPVAAGVLSSFGIDLTPMIASAAMSFSSVCVCLNSLLLKLFKATGVEPA